MSDPPSELVFQEVPIYVYERAASCPGCSRVESPSSGVYLNAGGPLPPFDLFRTLDGGIVASAAFRRSAEQLAGIEFVSLVGSVELMLVEVTQVVTIDPFQSHVKSGPSCTTCGRPRYVTRSGPIRLQADEDVPGGFSRTDLAFGDTADFGSSQPVRPRENILVDRLTARHLKSASLLGIHLITQP